MASSLFEKELAIYFYLSILDRCVSKANRYDYLLMNFLFKRILVHKA